MNSMGALLLDNSFRYLRLDGDNHLDRAYLKRRSAISHIKEIQP